MRLYLISCEVFYREFRAGAASSNHLIDITFQPFGLHDTPEALRTQTQQAIDAVPAGQYDYILIGYGLCCRGTAGLIARHTPLVLVRGHDCITFFLGSKERYLQEFTGNPGTYYYSSGWIERRDGCAEQGNIQFVKAREREKRFADYVRRFGEDNARYLIDMEIHWLSHYTRAAFINLDIGDTEAYRSFVQGIAGTQGWSYEEVPGDPRLMEGFLQGAWDPERFLVVHPGQQVVETHDERIFTVGPVDEAQP
jgi:hypothetical protein